MKGDDQATVEELVSQGEDLTRSDDVGQVSIVPILAIIITPILKWHCLILKVLGNENVSI